MSEKYQQQCPRCVGALQAARRRLDASLAEAARCRQIAHEAHMLALSEDRRARNVDPMHVHAGGRSADGECTLATHVADRDRALVDAKKARQLAREWEAAVIEEAKRIGKAADKLLAGCDLCGRAPIPVRGVET